MDYRIYSKPNCPFCVQATGLLDMKGIAYDKVSLDTPEAQAKLIESLGGWRTFPAIFALKDGKPTRFVGGFEALKTEVVG